MQQPEEKKKLQNAISEKNHGNHELITGADPATWSTQGWFD